MKHLASPGMPPPIAGALLVALATSGCHGTILRAAQCSALNSTIPYVITKSPEAGDIVSVLVPPGARLTLTSAGLVDNGTGNSSFGAYQLQPLQDVTWEIPRDAKTQWTNRDVTIFGWLVSLSTLRYRDKPNPKEAVDYPTPGEFLIELVTRHSGSAGRRKEWDQSVNKAALGILGALRLNLDRAEAPPAPTGWTGAAWKAEEFKAAYHTLEVDNKDETTRRRARQRRMGWGPLEALPGGQSAANGQAETAAGFKIEWIGFGQKGFIWPESGHFDESKPALNREISTATLLAVVSLEIDVQITLDARRVYVPVWSTVADLETSYSKFVCRVRRSIPTRNVDDTFKKAFPRLRANPDEPTLDVEIDFCAERPPVSSLLGAEWAEVERVKRSLVLAAGDLVATE